MTEYTPTMDRLRREYIEMREARFGFSDLYAAEWDRALAAHDAEVRAQGHHVVPCARCGQKPVVANDALNSDIVVCGDCGVQIGLHEPPEVRASVVSEEPEWEGTTPRGFGYTEIEVANYAGVQDRKFTVQQSSLATEHKVWIGLDDDRAHMNVEQATRVRDALNAFLASAWLPVEQED